MFGLTSNAVYHYQAVAVAGGVSYYGGDQSFEVTGPPEVPQITCNRVLAGSLTFQPSDNIDSALGVTNDPNILALNSGSLTQVSGLVADGVTPLLFVVTMPYTPDPPLTYQLSFNVNGAGSVSDLVTNLHVLCSSGWMQSTNLIMGGNVGYAYLGGLKSEDLANVFGGTNELTIELDLTPSGSSTPVTNVTFHIRRPPVVLVHGYNADATTWSASFLNTLKTNVPADFIVPINYGVTITAISSPRGVQYVNFVTNDNINTSAPLTNLVRLLEPELNRALTSCQSNWACTRYDVVCHSQGGVLTRMLCQTNNLGGSAFGSQPPVSAANFYRGRFRRVITIGSPHNGSLLLRYWLAMKRNGYVFENVFSTLLQQKFDPFGPQITCINSPLTPVDGRMKFNCVQCTLDSGQPNNVSCSSIFTVAFMSDLCDYVTTNSICGNPVPSGSSRFDFVTPLGSDGIVDFGSQGGGAGTPNTDFTSASLSHASPLWLFGSPSGSETAYFGMAGQVNELLAGPTNAFGSFESPVPFQTQCVIDSLVPPSLLKPIISWLSGSSNSGPQPQGRPVPHGSSCFDFDIQPTSGDDEAGDVTWFADIYGTNGLQECIVGYSTNGVSLEANGSNNASATVCVNSAFAGTVVLNANYLSTNGALICGIPVVVLTNAPGNLTNIFVNPPSLNPVVGESDPFEVWGEYDSGSIVQLFIGAASGAVWSSSNPSVYQVDTNGVGLAVSNGTATVSVTYSDYIGLATLTVEPSGYIIIASQPQSQLDNQGQTALLSISASGIGPIDYQWYFDGTAIIDATNSELIITNIQPANVGMYYVLISNSVV